VDYLPESLVVRALLASVNAIEQVTARAARRAQLPSGVGQHWTEDEEQRLKEAFARGDAVPDIAQRHNRTVRAIEAPRNCATRDLVPRNAIAIVKSPHL
jgi:hypothetical protein